MVYLPTFGLTFMVNLQDSRCVSSFHNESPSKSLYQYKCRRGLHPGILGKKWRGWDKEKSACGRWYIKNRIEYVELKKYSTILVVKQFCCQTMHDYRLPTTLTFHHKTSFKQKLRQNQPINQPAPPNTIVTVLRLWFRTLHPLKEIRQGLQNPIQQGGLPSRSL